MNKNAKKFLFSLFVVAMLAISLAVQTAYAVKNENILLASIPAEEGYIDFSYGSMIKEEPTAETAESKLWWNDGRWWGVLFDPVAQMNTIYWFDWGNKTWVKTDTTTDSRIDDTGKVAVRFDALWDNSANKLYLASHIKLDNPSRVNDPINHARLYRYSYNSSTRTYTLDSGFPVTINRDKTEALVIDKDSTGRMWAAYISRVPPSTAYKVFVTYSTTDLQSWSDPFDLTTINSAFETAATVRVDNLHDDMASVIAFGDQVGVMWSNSTNLEANPQSAKFYFATHPASSSPTTNWTLTPIEITGVPLAANDHIKLVKDSSGRVYAAIKTSNPNGSDPNIGVLARATNGTFSFLKVNNVSSFDTRPTMVLNEEQNRLYLFASSNEAGGVICVNTIQVPTLSLVSGGACSDSDGVAANFIRSTVYTNIDNATTTKQNINNNTGLVVLASDDKNGHNYLHNTLGNPLPIITHRNPDNGGTGAGQKVTVAVTFSHPMNPSTLNTSSFKVTLNGNPIPGNVAYNPATRTAIFTGSGVAVDGATYQVEVNNIVKDQDGRSLYNGGETWEFVMDVDIVPTEEPTPIPDVEGFNIFLPFTQR